MATCFSILVWKIPRTEEPGGLQSMGSQRVRHYHNIDNQPFSNIKKKKKKPKPKKMHTIYKKITSHSFMMLLMLALAKKPYTSS